MKKSVGEKGKLHINKFLQKFENGDKVGFVVYPSEQHGLFNLRIQGKHGIILGKQGNCYVVEYDDRGLKKKFVVNPVHLKRI